MSRVPSPRPVIVALGCPRSGSTWIFNVLRELAQALWGGSASIYAESDRDLENASSSEAALLVKVHYTQGFTRKIFENSRAVISTRDPRDAVVSTMDMFGFSFTDSNALIGKSLDGILPLAQRQGFLKYEHLFDDLPRSVNAISGLARLPTPSQMLVEKISSRMTADAVRSNIERLKRDGAMGGEASPFSHDPSTQWHPGHLKDGRVGKWSERLSATEAAEVVARNQAFVDALYPEIK